MFAYIFGEYSKTNIFIPTLVGVGELNMKIIAYDIMCCYTHCPSNGSYFL